MGGYTYKMSGYISEILNYEIDLVLGTTEVDFLQRFLKGKCSAYMIYSELANPHIESQDGNIYSENVHLFHRADSKLLGRRMAYKNVHTRIMRLAELHLIEKINHKYPGRHGAKFYKITRKGIFFLIYSSSFSPSSLRMDDLIRYHGDSVLETVLFPYFEDESLARHTARFFFAVSFYLVECCEIMLSEIKDIREEKDHDKKTRKIELLTIRLEENALSLAFELVTKFSPRALGYLADDKKFVNLAKKLKAKFDNGYDVFASEVAKRRR